MPPKLHTVLIADDSDADRYFLTNAIGHHAPSFRIVAEVSDGHQIVEYLAGEGEYADRLKYPFPDLLILDVRMPRMNGIEVLEWIQAQDFPDLKVAMLADSSGSIFGAEALKLGVDHFYPKSIGLDQLAGVVKDLEAKMWNGHARIP